MRLLVVFGALLMWMAGASAQDQPQPGPQESLPWAYALNTPGAESLHDDDGMQKHIPGSRQSLSLSETRDFYRPPDWHPGDHPEMPDIVARGRNPGVYACAYCHLPNGQGRPENASLAGLPAAYIVQQMADYRAGLRRSAEPQLLPASIMLAIGATATEAEVAAAAAYFSGLVPQKWITVVETDTVPETVIAGWMHVPVPNGSVVPIDERIIEVAENLERTELRDSRSGFLAYVPKGSVERGKILVTRDGDDESQPCTICHGDDLRGLGPVPRLAGCSPSYIVRQLYDMQSGAWKGAWSPLMQSAVATLSVGDLVAIAAYAASLDP